MTIIIIIDISLSPPKKESVRRFEWSGILEASNSTSSSNKYKNRNRKMSAVFFQTKEMLAINWYQRMRYKHITISLLCVPMPLSAISFYWIRYPSVCVYVADILYIACYKKIKIISLKSILAIDGWGREMVSKWFAWRVRPCPCPCPCPCPLLYLCLHLCHHFGGVDRTCRVVEWIFGLV